MTAHTDLIRIGNSNFALHEFLDALRTHSELPLGSSVKCTLRKDEVALDVVCALLSNFEKQ